MATPQVAWHQDLGRSDTWGADPVRPRDVHNGIEDPEWSYWGGRPILEPDGKYHLFVARWPEDNPRGHGGWPNSEIAHATSDQPETIRVQIRAEEGFDPQAEVDVESLRFGAPEEVDFGRGCKAVGSEKSGNDLLVTFNAAGHGITAENFAAKLIGKTTGGKLLFGYSRLPGVHLHQPDVNSRLLCPNSARRRSR